MQKKINNSRFLSYIRSHWVALLVAGGVVGGFLYAASFSPGGMSTDSIDQFAQAVGDRRLHDWHPPIMAWFWGVLINITHHPGSLHMFMSMLFTASIILLALYVYGISRSKWLSLIPFCFFLIPTVSHFLPMVWKDTYMMELLLLATVLLLWVGRIAHKVLRWSIVGILLLLIFLSFCLRYNAIFAIIPILIYVVIMLLPRLGIWSLTGVILASALAAVVMQGVINGPILNVRKANPSSSIMLDDLMHIPLNIKSADNRNTVKELHNIRATCDVWKEMYFYNIIWKCLSDEQIKIITNPDDKTIRNVWIRSVISSPLQYMKYRAATFKAFLFNVPTDGYDTTIVRNDYGLEFKGRLFASSVMSLNRVALRDFGFIYRVYFWFGVAIVGLVMVYRQKALKYRREMMMLFSSAILYIIGYFPMMISIEIRYILWAVVATILGWMLYVVGRASEV